MIYFCTLFDSAYLSRGLAMYESLLACEPEAFLSIFTFDQTCYEVLTRMNLKQVKVFALADFENERLLAIKPSRTRAEYCWTCKATAILHVLDTFSADSCTYLDADLYLFHSPKILLDEMKGRSVLLTPHRFTKQYDSSITNGEFCAQYISFKNTVAGREVLNWWNDACIEWCFARHEENKYGDQKYLEQMIEKFPSVLESKNLGAVGPWNMQQYTFYNKENKLFGREIESGREFEVIFFHFHAFRFLPGSKKANLGSYAISQSAFQYIYRPFSMRLLQINKILQTKFGLSSMDENKAAYNWKSPLRFIKRKLRGLPRIVKVSKLIAIGSK
ncbi:MAG: glycosyl transferase [Gammaproteobacteria bacterium]|nr:glycosyl transferase [Gammaproteobacteria bacterium]